MARDLFPAAPPDYGRLEGTHETRAQEWDNNRNNMTLGGNLGVSNQGGRVWRHPPSHVGKFFFRSFWITARMHPGESRVQEQILRYFRVIPFFRVYQTRQGLVIFAILVAFTTGILKCFGY